jgi:hypothetical protein
MDKAPMTKQEIERLLIAELHSFPDCEEALHVVIVPIEDRANDATWTVTRFNYGNSDGEACDRALHRIVPRFQRMYDMVQKH